MKRDGDRLTVEPGETIVEIWDGSDERRRYSFTVYWWSVDGCFPDGGSRGQCFYGDPYERLDRAHRAGQRCYQIDTRPAVQPHFVAGDRIVRPWPR